MPPKTCGQHTELASNDSVRVTRCTCGTVHVTLLSNGITVRMSADSLRAAAAGLSAAADRVEQPMIIGSSTIN